MYGSWLRAMPVVVLSQVVVATAGAEQPVTTTVPVIVSATRTAQSVERTLAPVSVITREDIQRLQANSVQDVLRGLPGVALSNNGGRGKQTSVFLRGTESDHVMVLIDGVKVGSATAGLFAFQDLPVEQIERIEVVRGPRASLYGSEAIGGVIQIFTRRGGDGFKPYARVTAGSRGTREGSLGVSGGDERAWFSLSGNADVTDGFDACRGSFAGGCFTVEPDRDGYRNRGVSARAGYRFDSGLELEGHLLRTSADVEFDGGFQNESENRQAVHGARLSFAPLDPWRVSASVGHARDEADSFKDAVFASEFITRRDSVSVQNDVELAPDHLAVVGFDFQRDRVAGSTAFTVTSRRNRGVFGQYLGSFGDHDLEASLRHDDNQQFGASNTGSAAWGWRLHRALRLVASYGTAFKAPSFNELYFPGFGNPNLAPEESRTIEFALNGSVGAARWGLNVFQTDVDDQIAFDAATFAPANIGRSRIRGLEASLAGRVAGFDASASLSVLDPRNRDSSANRGNQLPRRPRQVLRLDLDRAIGAWSLGTTVLAEGARYDDLANTQRLGGFVTLDLRAAYRIDEDWTVQARVENVFDKRYETAGFFNQPGRGAFVTLRYQP
jgi:vitamin B12 transporter